MWEKIFVKHVLPKLATSFLNRQAETVVSAKAVLLKC